MTSELERVSFLAQRFTGIGDDCAVLEGELVWTVDAQVEGTHFRLDWLDWSDVGWRSFVAAASDIGAMGGTPTAALSALVLAENVDDVAFDALTRGQLEASRAVGAPLVGGNLARGRETSVTTTVLGRAASPVLRSGARAGDGVFVAGRLGLAAAGLALLERGLDEPVCIAAWRRPEVIRLRAPRSTAMIDVSDGLAHDLAQLAVASGVAVVLDALPIDPALERAAALLGRDPIELVLHGGEDYALVATGAELEGFARIGTVVAGAGLSLRLADGTTRVVDARGFDHFASS